MGSGALREAAVGEHGPPLPLQMQVKTVPCEAKAVHRQHPEAPPAPLGPSSPGMDRRKVEEDAVV